MRAAHALIASGRIDPRGLVTHRLALSETARAGPAAPWRGDQGGRRAVRAAMLHGPGELRVEQVDEPEGEVVVAVEAATACATDLKMLRHGHRVLGPYPARFGHETVGVREDSGERVLVGDSVACGACAACGAGRAQLCEAMTWVLGGFAERIAAPSAALHAVPDGLEPAGAAMAEPLAAAVHAVARAGDGADAAVLGGGTMGLMLARLLVLEGRDVTLVDRHPERRAQAQACGARTGERLGRHELVLEAVGRPESWRAAIDAAAPGATVVLVGGCPASREVTLPPRRCTTRSSTSAVPSATRRPRSTARWRCSRPAPSTGARSQARRSASASCTTRSCDRPRASRASSSWTLDASLPPSLSRSSPTARTTCRRS